MTTDENALLTDYPWKRVGVPIIGLLTVQEALQFAGQNFTATKVEYSSTPDDPNDAELYGIKAPDKFMVVRRESRAYMGTVGTRYKVIQPIEGFGFFDHALGEGAACVEAVGCVGKHNQTLFMVARIPDMVEIVPGDPIERHILFINSFDGSSNIEARFINWRTASATALQTPFSRSADRVRIMHTKNAGARLRMSKHILAKNDQYWERCVRVYRYLAKRDVSGAVVRDLLEHLFPDVVKEEDGETVCRTSPQAAKKRKAVTDLFEGSCPGANLAGATGYGLYNSLCYFVDHERALNKKQKEAGTTRWEISTMGSGEKLRTKALTWLQENL